MASVVFYISGHGFGHAVRQIAIVNALFAARLPERDRIVIRTDAAAWLFGKTLRGPCEVQRVQTDTGVVQIDSLQPDEKATIERAIEFHRDLPARASQEAAVLRGLDARLVVADAPPLGCAAAAEAGIPAVVCSNFTWDWIYGDYREQPGAGELVDRLGEAYRLAHAGWRMPLHGGFATIAPIVDLPFVARRARADITRDELRRALDLPAGRRLALVSFGGYGLRALPMDRLDCLERWSVVISSASTPEGPLRRGVHHVAEPAMYASGLRYEDLVRAVDVVITKPGYGIISDCVANNTAMLYTSRGRFAEYDVMIREMPRYLRCRYLERDAFVEGRWLEGLEALAGTPAPPEEPRTDGADVAARMILERLSAP